MAASDVPPVKGWFQNGFHRFLRPFLRRHFHSIAADRESLDPLDLPPGPPLIVYANHPSWWDPLVAHFLNRSVFVDRQFYAPIDAQALEQYGVFEQLGFYGVRLESLRGARDFLTRSGAIATAGGTAIWITPEGRFTDVRDHSVSLMPGLPHLCRQLDAGWVVPLALEYAFWDDRLPNCFARFGPPIPLATLAKSSKPDVQRRLSDALRECQRRLADSVIARSDQPFENLLSGRAGAGTFYDTVRRWNGWIRGKQVRTSHGDHFR